MFEKHYRLGLLQVQKLELLGERHIEAQRQQEGGQEADDQDVEGDIDMDTEGKPDDRKVEEDNEDRREHPVHRTKKNN